MATWTDIEKALNSDSIESLDKATLEAFARVEVNASQNQTYFVRYQQAQFRIARALDKFTAKESEAREAERQKALERRIEELKVSHWTVIPNFWLTAVAAVAAVLAVYFAWRAVQPAVPPLPTAASQAPASSGSKPLPAAQPQKP